jgi:hypothetical protein
MVWKRIHILCTLPRDGAYVTCAGYLGDDSILQRLSALRVFRALLPRNIFLLFLIPVDRLCGLVVRVLGYRSGSPGSIPGTTRKKKVVGLERGALSLVSTIEELLDKKVAAPVQKIDNTDVGIRHADHVAPSIRKSWQSLRREAAVARSDSSLADSGHGLCMLFSFLLEAE